MKRAAPQLLEWGRYTFITVAYLKGDYDSQCLSWNTSEVKAGVDGNYTGITEPSGLSQAKQDVCSPYLVTSTSALMAIHPSICRPFSTVCKSLTSVFILLFFSKPSLFLRFFPQCNRVHFMLQKFKVYFLDFSELEKRDLSSLG